MDIPVSDAILDDGSTEPITLTLEKTQVDWMQSRAKAKNMSVDQVARYVINWFIRHEDPPRWDSENSETSPDPKEMLDRLQKTKKRLEALREDVAPTEDRDASSKGEEAHTPDDGAEDEDTPPSMFDMARTPSESGSDGGAPSSSSELSPPKADVETHFGGPWSAQEMKKVKAALGRIEAKRPQGSAPPNPVWICTAVGGKGETRFYFATRQKTDRVFRAQTCVDLINRIAQSIKEE